MANLRLHVGDITLFDNPKADKEQATKILEEAAEVFAVRMERLGALGGDAL